ncbi:hypothetical protein PanWU01x14_203940 [Parasponia andersonii]|uniref:Uncharacterized protein n=1 Tax=Parasponia andersonii TaxID=3476 RepID=A0A2P5BWK2_PARAD|nr:hypothetical protein PanWU01x14_203940 [Parasponia andersonii]
MEAEDLLTTGDFPQRGAVQMQPGYDGDNKIKIYEYMNNSNPENQKRDDVNMSYTGHGRVLWLMFLRQTRRVFILENVVEFLSQ